MVITTCTCTYVGVTIVEKFVITYSLLKQSDKDKLSSHADETLDETKGSASMEGDSEANSSGDSLETSFFRELKVSPYSVSLKIFCL